MQMQAVTLLWTFKLPWRWAYHGSLVSPWTAQFAFGFYSVMLTSTVLVPVPTREAVEIISAWKEDTFFFPSAPSGAFSSIELRPSFRRRIWTPLVRTVK